MELLLAAKGGDVLAWRGTSDIDERLRTKFFEQMAFLSDGAGIELLEQWRKRLADEIAEDNRIAARFEPLIRQLEETDDLALLNELGQELRQTVADYFRSRGAVCAVHRLCGRYREVLVRRVLVLAERGMEQSGAGPAPVPFAWILLGSDARLEATFDCTIDSLLVYADEVRGAGRYFESFSRRVEELLPLVGLRANGIVSPRGAEWRGSREEWRRRIKADVIGERSEGGGGLRVPLTELRPVYGDPSLAIEMAKLICSTVQRNPVIVQEEARAIVSLPSPLGFLGRFKTERSGNYRGTFDFRQYVWLPLVAVIRVYAVRNGITETNSLARVKRLLEEGRLSVVLVEQLMRAYHDITGLKIKVQLRDGWQVRDYHLGPEELTHDEETALRSGIESLVTMQKIVYQTIVGQG